MQTHFLNRDILNLATGIALIIVSIFLYLKNRFSLSIVILTVGAFVLRLFIIKLDPFLYSWDERFHALVAKNMMENPFRPMLYVNPIFSNAPYSWVSSHIWLHKGPVFLWLIAISFKIFGVNEIALRIPSVLISSFMIPVIYRMGKIIFNERLGYMAAFLFATANYQLEMVTGIINTDHNDVIFMCLVCASFWAWLEYKYSQKKYWLILMGLFSGMAVLTKWVIGFLVFFCWFIAIITNRNQRKQLTSYLQLIKSFFIAFILALSWYLYCFISFPEETRTTLRSYSSTFSSVIESHSGNGTYYFDLLGVQYGWIVPFIILPCLYFLYKAIENKKDYKVMLITWLLFVEIFYALAQTKMPLFVIIVAPIIYLAMGKFLLLASDYLANRIKKYGIWITAVLMVFIGFTNIGVNEIEGHHTDTGLMVGQREEYIHNVAVFKKVAAELPNKNYVLFNCKDAIRTMFYTGAMAYSVIPDSMTLNKLEEQNIKIAIFDDEKLPKYILNDPKTLKLQDTIRNSFL